MAFDTKNIRNVVLLGHSGSGKTSLCEAMLFEAKEIDRIGLSITERRNSFNEIASKSKIEWFRNSWMTYKPQNLIQEINLN